MKLLISEDELEAASSIDVGCGRNKHPDADIGTDIRPDTDADILIDLTQEHLPIESRSISTIYLTDVLEHVPNGLIDMITELHRVLEDDGALRIEVPGQFYDPPSKNPNHVRRFDSQWFYSWDPTRHEHQKWDNFTCIPFSTELVEVERLSVMPWSIIRRQIQDRPNFPPWMIKRMTIEMKKETSCPRHPSVTHDS